MNVMVLDRFRIEARPPTLDLAEGSTYAISVNLSRIEAARDVTVTVTIMNPLEGSGLTLSTSLLTFSNMEQQPVTVEVPSDDRYTGDRSATLTLTARGYVTTMVTVDIIENTLQPITLDGVPTELNLVRFTRTMVGVRVDIDADLMVKEEGAVRLVGDVPTSLTGSAEATQIQIEGENVGEGTVTFTVSGVRKATARAVVRVMVSTPTLVITEVSPPTINLLTRETTVVTVSVSAIGNPSSTLKATVTGTGNSVTPTEMTNVRAGTPATFTVIAGLDAGDETLTLTASHPDYDSTSTKVDVRVDLRPLELSVEPSPLEVVIGTSKVLMIGVSATEGVTLTVTVDRDDRIRKLADEYLLTSGETRTEISVRGDNIGDTTLTIEAEAEGYTSATTTVSIEVLDLLRIKAMPATFELAEDASTQIRVSLNRIDAARDTVTVTIKPEGSGLTVSPSSLTFSRSSLGPQFITVDTTTDRTYTGDRSRMLTLTARGYATTMVMVDIIENTLQSIRLDGVPTKLSLVRFTSTMIEVSVDIDADLMVKAEGAVRLAGDRRLVSSNLGGENPLETEIEISGVSEGEGTVTFTVSGDRKATDTVVVSVTVTRPRLVISEVSPSNINLLTRETTIVTVSVSAVGDPSSTLKATVTGTGNSVTPTEITGVRVGTTTTFTVTAGLNAGNETLTLTARHPDYDSTSTEVTVNVSLRPLELSVEPSPLEVVIGTSKILMIGVSATEGVTLTVTVDRDDRIRELADEYLLTSGETRTEISVRGG